MSIKVQGQVVISDDKKGLFEQVNPGSYTTAQRDALSPATGDIIYNSEDEELQVWDGTQWGSAGSGGANGIIQPEVEVLTPLDRAGDTELTYLKSDRIVAIEAEDGTVTNETDTIQSVGEVAAITPVPSPDPFRNPATWATFSTNNSQNDPNIFDFVIPWDMTGVTYYNGGGYSPGDTFKLIITFTDGTTWTSSNYTTASGYGSPFNIAVDGFDGSKGVIRVEHHIVSGTPGYANTCGFYNADQSGAVYPYATAPVLTFPTSNNFDKFAVGDKTEGPTTFNPDSGGNTGTGALSADNLTITADSVSYIERSSFAPVFVDSTYSEFTMIGSVVGGVGIGDAAARVISGAGQYVVYRENGAIIKYPGNLTVTTTAAFVDGDVIGVQCDASTNTLSFFKNGTLQASFEINQYSFTGDLFAHAALIPNSDCSITANFGASPYQTAAAEGYGDLNAGSDILVINSDANTITVDGGQWDSSPSQYDKSYVWATTADDSGLSVSSSGASSWTHVFDNPNDPALSASVADANQVAAVDKFSEATLNLPAELTGTVDIFASKYTTSTGQTQSFIDFMYNGTIVHRYDVSAVRAYEAGWIGEVTLSGPANQIRLYDGNTTQFAGVALQAVKNNGKILVNSGLYTGDDRISKTVAYETKLTLEGSTDLAQMALGPAVMTDGVLGASGYSQTPYTLTTTDINSITATQSYSGNCTSLVGTVTTYPNLFDGNPSTALTLGGPEATLKLDLTWLPAGGIENPTLIQTVVNSASMNGEFIANFGLEDESSTGSVNTGTHTIPVAPSLLKNLVWRTTVYDSASWNPINVYVNNVQLVDYTLNTLAFPGDVSTNPDLRYFQAGDVVQSDYNQSQTWSTYGTFTGDFATDYVWANVFSYAEDTGSTGAMYLNSGIATWTLTAPLACSTSVRFKQAGSTSYTINKGLPDETTAVSPVSDDLTIPFTGNIQNIHVNTINTYVIRMFVDGKALIDPQYDDPSAVTAISTDLAANTMTVDGGEWLVYDDSQHWSDFGTGINYGNRTWSKAFDGVISESPEGHALPAAGETMTWTPTTPITVNDTLILYGLNDTDSASYGLRLNGGSSFILPTTSVYGSPIVVPASSIGGSLSKIELVLNGSGYGPYLTGVSVDGKLLVDGYLDSQVWSSVVTVSTLDGSYPLTNGFDEDQTNVAAAQAGSPVTLGFGTIFSSTAVHLEVLTSDGRTVQVDGVTKGTAANVSTTEWVDCGTTTFSEIAVGTAPAGYGGAFYAIRVDGKLLVDAGLRNLGDSKVQSITPGGTGNIVQIDTSDNTMLLSNSNDYWIANNKAGTAFSVAAGSLANPPAPDYLDIAFTSMNAGTTPFTGISATLSSRTWTLETAPYKSGPWSLVNTYEDFDMTASQDGATPWTTNKPVLVQSTWYRVKVTYNSTNASSVESAYHTFKTGV